jgi:hypothetical protein
MRFARHERLGIGPQPFGISGADIRPYGGVRAFLRKAVVMRIDGSISDALLNYREWTSIGALAMHYNDGKGVFLIGILPVIDDESSGQYTSHRAHSAPVAGACCSG